MLFLDKYLKTIHIISVLQGIKGGAIVQSIGKQNWVKLIILSPGGLFFVFFREKSSGQLLARLIVKGKN